MTERTLLWPDQNCHATAPAAQVPFQPGTRAKQISIASTSPSTNSPAQ